MPEIEDDSGMTLIELLMAMAILMIIITPIIGAFFLALVTADSTSQRVTDSGGAQILSSYLSSDVQSASDTVRDEAPFDCDSDAVLELGWRDAKTGDSTRVAYVPAGQPDEDAQLLRLVYQHAPSGCTLEDESVLLRAVDVPSIEVTCSPSPCGATTRAVRLDLTALGKAPRDDTYYAPFPISLTGTRRTAS